ncbi:SDR family NAD(P)-dependent oxidoreductase [Capillimicrobium parvum]|uniref:Dihydroanticapsin 7-dehydrogenase n=1 Tax=Capillimicrobium parvum TaxID=2884022 RepID=A0A9E7C0D3_9ACTN|nr:SDR family NAD(P)-dependent oxidoreductase [Capillimicrobium parvum]UGS35278.1 Dihydroanticapsin 7-dehydrogenase [Capillimicrobium parvum]
MTGRTVIVTGAGRGIGAAIAFRLGGEGAWVACLDVDGQSAEATAAALPRGGRSFAVDVGDEAAVRSALAAVVAERGAVHAVVNNAGIAGPQEPAGSTDLAAWEQTLRVNLTGAFLVSKHALEPLRRTDGAIVNVASALAFVGLRAESAYGPSKAGLVQLTKGMALDYAPDVRVNAVCPGAVRTPMIASVVAPGDSEALMAEYGRIHPLHRRLAAPEEIADAVLFLASDDASFVTGTALLVDAGLTA